MTGVQTCALPICFRTRRDVSVTGPAFFLLSTDTGNGIFKFLNTVLIFIQTYEYSVTGRFFFGGIFLQIILIHRFRKQRTQMRAADAVLIGSVAVLMCVLAGLYPALRAARLAPATVLHSDA